MRNIRFPDLDITGMWVLAVGRPGLGNLRAGYGGVWGIPHS